MDEVEAYLIIYLPTRLDKLAFFANIIHPSPSHKFVFFVVNKSVCGFASQVQARIIK